MLVLLIFSRGLRQTKFVATIPKVVAIVLRIPSNNVSGEGFRILDNFPFGEVQRPTPHGSKEDTLFAVCRFWIPRKHG